MHRQLPLASSRLPKTLPVPRSKEAKWVRQLAAGESTAWLHLMEQWNSRLYTYVLYQGLTESETQLLLPVIFAEVVQSVVGKLRVTNLTVLIFSIASQQVLDHCRQRPLAPPKAQAPVSRLDDEHQRLFLQTLRQFTLEAQQVLLLYYLFDVTLPEIAQIVGQPEAILLKVLYRFKHSLP
jgi:DNA-directed RNA polymerase specialized sigma24 family protein